MDRFLLAENPMKPNASQCAIIHTIDPIAIIRCELDQKRAPAEHHLVQIYINSDGLPEEWTLEAHHLFTTNMNAADSEAAKSIAEKLLVKAWRWYRSYLEWTDRNIDDQNFATNN